MHVDHQQAAGLSRRSFLKTSAMGGMLLATGSSAAVLTGCAKVEPQNGYDFLRAQDIAVLTALTPVVLADVFPTDDTAPKAIEDVLRSIDQFIYATGPSSMAAIQELFDLLSMPPARWTLCRLWKDWPEASPAELEAFLQRWKGSSVGLLRAGYGGLAKIITAAWYLLPQSWEAIDYNGPQHAPTPVANAGALS
ncbi:MAG: twin-arginine translocation signal domain-containing protein [Moraxellaceae bacterium]|nr:twin-arginine translocation signal domain-containing protein [Moraxellaceae bacterium]